MIVKLKDVISKVIDNRGKTPNICEHGIKLLEINSIVNVIRYPNYSLVSKYVSKETYDYWFRSGHPQKDDVLVSTVGTIGKFALVDNEQISIAQNLVGLRFNPDIILPHYAFYCLSSPYYQNQIHNLDIGGVQPNLKIPHLLNFEIGIHDKETQSHIVDILGSIDNSIENNEHIARDLERLAGEIYKREILSIENKIRLEEVIEILDSKRIPLSSRERETRKGIYPYYGATGILDYVNDYIFSGEYVLLAEDGTVIDESGYPIVQIIKGDFWVNNHAHILNAVNGYSNYLLYISLKNTSVTKAVTGAVQLKINQANMCALELPKLDDERLLTLNSQFKPIADKIFHLKDENKKLKELKELYLKKFFG